MGDVHQCASCKRCFDSEKGLRLHYAWKKQCLSVSASYPQTSLLTESHQPQSGSKSPCDSTEHASDCSESRQSHTHDDFHNTHDANSESAHLSHKDDSTSFLTYPTEDTKSYKSTVAGSPVQPPSLDNGNLSVDGSSWTRFTNHIIHEKPKIMIPYTYQSDVELLYLLQKANAPISLYDEIQNWARSSFAKNESIFLRTNMSRPAALKLIEKRFDASGVFPRPVTIFLPNARQHLTIQTFDFSNAVYSLLTDPVLMREENLDLDTTENKDTNQLYPFPFPLKYTSRPNEFVYKEFSNGELYYHAYDHYCKDHEVMEGKYLHMPLVIIGQLDKTFIDSKGKLTLEPFKISLHIFKEKVRRHDIAWRPLGYISNQSNLPTYKNSRAKAEDYHVILGTVVNSLKSYQQQYDVFLWDLKIRGSIVHVAFHPVFGYMIGDNEGHDKMCGKYLNRMKVKRLCRCCDTPIEFSDDPYFSKWKLTQGRQIAKLVSQGRSELLQTMSYHCIENAMTGIKFADPIRGVNGATPAERLHLLNHGLFQIILEYNFGQKRAKITKANVRLMVKRRLSDSDSESDEEKEDEDLSVEEEEQDESEAESDVDDQSSTVGGIAEVLQPELTQVALFTPTVCNQFDSDAKQYGRLLQKQSSRYWNRSFFYHGITSNSRKVGHEERNCLLLCLLIYTSSRYNYYSPLLDPERPPKKTKRISTSTTATDGHSNTKRLDYLIELISETLHLEQFMLQDSIPKSTLQLAQKYIPHYLNFLKQVCHRDTGMGWKLTKFHIPLHMVSDIQRLSIPNNFDSNVVESHHKQEKKSGRRTQMQASSLEAQTAKRRTEYMIVNRAYEDLFPPDSLFENNEDDTAISETVSYELSSNKLAYIQSHSGLFFTNKKGIATEKVKSIPEANYLLQQVNEFLDHFFSRSKLPDTGVPIYTRLSIDSSMDPVESKQLYRGDPFWKSRRGEIEPNKPSREDVESEDVESYPTSDAWNDFAYIRWRTNTLSAKSTKETVIPGKILFFLEIPLGCIGEDEENIVYPPGRYAMVQSCVENLFADPPRSKMAIEYYKSKYGQHATIRNYLAHPSCSIIYWTIMELIDYPVSELSNHSAPSASKVPQLYIVNIENICGSCIAVPYDLKQNPTIEWLIVCNREEWAELFLQDMEVRLSLLDT